MASSNSSWSHMRWSCAIACTLLALSAAPAFADVKTRDKGQVKFEGMLGTMMRMFGGKALSEGIVSTNAVKGERKATLNDLTGRIVDLGEQKVYDLDMKKKTYTVTTFDELRQKLREAQERAAKEAKEAPKEAGEPAPAVRQRQADRVRLRREGDRTDAIDRRLRRQAGHHDRHRAREGQDARGKRRRGPDRRFLARAGHSGHEGARRVRDEVLEGHRARRRRSCRPSRWPPIAAIYPMIKPAMDRLNQEKVSLKGTPLATTMTFEGVKSKAQVEDAEQEQRRRGPERHARAKDRQDGRRARARPSSR